ncbi:MAG: hypothetical protein O2854_01645 [Chloroflexi bacterium]|nr:hypothetical protein [Chloroflexota bacterium]
MKQDRLLLATLIPALSLVVVATIGLGLGGIFIAIRNEWATIGIGMALVIGVPLVAVALEKMAEGNISVE